MEHQVVTAWEIKAFDHIVLNGRQYIVLSKNLVPVGSGSEIGFCVNCMEQGRRERSWKTFRWNEQITRIN
nr:MAG TPA: hypothetical protein [Caudoviricetes sp.]